MKNPENILRKISLFSSLTESELKIFYSILKPKEIEKGKILFHEGHSGDEMYIVLKGLIGIVVKTSSGELEIAEIREGSFFGEMSIFDNSPRSATSVIKEDSSLLTLSAADFYNSINKYPEITIKIMHKMTGDIAQRLDRIGAFVSDMILWGEKARLRAITDEFTGLYNRRFLDEALYERFNLAKQKGNALSLVMVDLDYFSLLNKEYGLEIGDKVILSAATVFKEVFRKEDILVRWGGDEFTFVLSDTDQSKAYELCEKVVQTLRTKSILENKGNSVRATTASIGIATFPSHAETLCDLKERSDKALYRAKELGRNRTVIFGN